MTSTRFTTAMRGLLLCLSMLGLSAGLSIDSAWAQAATSPEALARARVLSDQGRMFHDRGEYGRAVDAFQAAYVLAPSPGILFNLGQAYRLKGDCDNAVLMYRGYLRSQPALQLQEIAKAHLSSVETCASSAVMTGKPEQVVVLSKSGTGGDVQPGRGLRRGGVVTAISGGALLGLAGYFAYRAADVSDEVEQRYGRGEKWRDLEDLDDRGDRYGKLATGLAVTGGVAVITGGVLYLMGWRQGERNERTPALSISPVRSGGAVRFAWEF